MTGRPRQAHRSTSLVLLVWLFIFFAFAGTTLLAWHPLTRAAGVLVYGAPVLAWVVLRERRPVDRLDVAVLVGVAAHLLVSLTSLDPESSLEMSAAVAAYAATFLLARRLAADGTLRRVSATAVATALVFWLVVLALTWAGEKIGAVQQVGWPPPLAAHQPYVWGSINTAPAVTLLAAPFIAWLPAPAVRRALLATWLASSLVVVPLSLGRAGWLGLAVAAASLEPLFGFRVSRWLGRGARLQNHTAWALIAVMLAVVGGAAVLASSRFGGVGAELDSRARLWQQALALFAGDPLTGAGPSTFGWARLTVIPDYVDRVGAKDVHSVPLQTLSDGGLVLSAAALLVVVAWISVVFERRHALNTPHRLTIAALVGYAAMALLDDLGFLPAVTVALIFLAAWAIPTSPGFERRQTGGVLAFAIPVAFLGVAVATAPSVVSMTAARLHAADGREAAVRGDWADALTSFRNAADTHPQNALNWMSVGLAAARTANTDDAVAAYERARLTSPGDPRPWGALAALDDDRDSRLGLLEEAARRANDPRYAYRLGSELLRDGSPVEAARYFAIAVTLHPDWFAAVPEELWPAVRHALPDAIRTVGSVAARDPREARWNAGLALGDVPDEAPPQWHAVQLALTGDFDASAALIGQARREQPHSQRTEQAAVAVARLRCDRGAYDEARERLARLGAEGYERGHPVTAGRPGVYREPELGDYQPIAGATVPDIPQWPLGLVDVPRCGW